MDGHVEEQIAAWRGFVARRPTIATADVEELEGHLRDRIDDLRARGLSDDEAFLVAVRRMGQLDELSREFAREHSDRLWKQLVIGEADAPGVDRTGWRWPSRSVPGRRWRSSCPRCSAPTPV